MVSKLVNLAIVDNHTILRRTLKSYLSEQGNINVVIQSPDIPDLLRKLKDTYVHMLLMDLFLPEINGFDAIKIIQHQYPDIKILVITMCNDLHILSELFDCGIYGILSKADEPEEVINAISSVADHRIYCSKLLTEVMYWGRQNNMRKPGELHVRLNEREKEVLQLLWEEKSNKEIANHLFLGIRSVEKIRQDMKEKLNVKSTIGLLKYGIKEKIIQVNSPLLPDVYFAANEKQVNI
jgi:DNA-binding NarL/FixJ family response regulator